MSSSAVRVSVDRNEPYDSVECYSPKLATRMVQ